MAHKSIELATAHFDGNQAKAARAIGMSQQLFHYYHKTGKPLPAEFVPKLSGLTGIAMHDLRPDIYPKERMK